jgi:hypothetical protein
MQVYQILKIKSFQEKLASLLIRLQVINNPLRNRNKIFLYPISNLKIQINNQEFIKIVNKNKPKQLNHCLNQYISAK